MDSESGPSTPAPRDMGFLVNAAIACATNVRETSEALRKLEDDATTDELEQAKRLRMAADEALELIDRVIDWMVEHQERFLDQSSQPTNTSTLLQVADTLLKQEALELGRDASAYLKFDPSKTTRYGPFKALVAEIYPVLENRQTPSSFPAAELGDLGVTDAESEQMRRDIADSILQHIISGAIVADGLISVLFTNLVALLGYDDAISRLNEALPAILSNTATAGNRNNILDESNLNLSLEPAPFDNPDFETSADGSVMFVPSQQFFPPRASNTLVYYLFILQGAIGTRDEHFGLNEDLTPATYQSMSKERLCALMALAIYMWGNERKDFYRDELLDADDEEGLALELRNDFAAHYLLFVECGAHVLGFPQRVESMFPGAGVGPSDLAANTQSASITRRPQNRRRRTRNVDSSAVLPFAYALSGVLGLGAISTMLLNENAVVFSFVSNFFVGGGNVATPSLISLGMAICAFITVKFLTQINVQNQNAPLARAIRSAPTFTFQTIASAVPFLGSGASTAAGLFTTYANANNRQRRRNADLMSTAFTSGATLAGLSSVALGGVLGAIGSAASATYFWWSTSSAEQQIGNEALSALDNATNRLVELWGNFTGPAALYFVSALVLGSQTSLFATRHMTISAFASLASMGFMLALFGSSFAPQAVVDRDDFSLSISPYKVTGFPQTAFPGRAISGTTIEATMASMAFALQLTSLIGAYNVARKQRL